MHHFADRLLAACRDKGAPVCVGLDPVFERLPEPLRKEPAIDGILLFCEAVIDAVADHVPCVKPQLACFERHGVSGLEAYEAVVKRARDRGLLIIADGKRGDIGVSAAHYAAAFFQGPYAADALTVNAYLGGDALEPFISLAEKEGRGLFALVRTSNPGGDALQSLPLADGRTVSDAVADLVADAGHLHVGSSGYSLVGAVVGATKPQDARRLRERMPEQLFLVPGFGAQGGGVEDIKACFKPDGTGALITASRSVIFAYEQSTGDWQRAIADAAATFNRQIADALRG